MRITGTQLQVLNDLCTFGDGNNAIAERNNKTVYAVKSAVRKLMFKTGTYTRAQLVIWGLRNGFGDEE